MRLLTLKGVEGNPRIILFFICLFLFLFFRLVLLVLFLGGGFARGLFFGSGCFLFLGSLLFSGSFCLFLLLLLILLLRHLLQINRSFYFLLLGSYLSGIHYFPQDHADMAGSLPDRSGSAISSGHPPMQD